MIIIIMIIILILIPLLISKNCLAFVNHCDDNDGNPTSISDLTNDNTNDVAFKYSSSLLSFSSNDDDDDNDDNTICTKLLASGISKDWHKRLMRYSYVEMLGVLSSLLLLLLLVLVLALVLLFVLELVLVLVFVRNLEKASLAASASPVLRQPLL